MQPYELAEKQLTLFEKNLKGVMTDLEKKIEAIILSFKNEGGKFIYTPREISRTLSIEKQLEKAVRDSGYIDLIDEMTKKNKELFLLQKEEIKSILKAKGIPITGAFGNLDAKTIKGLIGTNFDRMLLDSDTAIASISKALYDNVLAGAPIPAMMETMKGTLGSFEGHAKTYARTSKRMFTQTIEDNIAEEIGFGDSKDDIYEYIGAPLQDNSRNICVHILEDRATPYFTQAMRDEFDTGSFEGVDFDVRRFNCQHNFAITNLTYKEAFGG